MKKKSFVLALVLLLSVFVSGCGDKEPKPTEAAKLAVTIKNSTGYMFNELFVSPTASNEWGDDHLGSTSVLKNNGTFDITLIAYDFNTYDISVTDEDGDVYLFERVPLKDKCQVEIVWESRLGAYVTYEGDDEDVYVTGNMEGSASDDDLDEWLEIVFVNSTSWDFTEIYIFESGSNAVGYNHIANMDLYVGDSCDIGVGAYGYYTVMLIDEDQDTWTFEGVELADGCDVFVGVEPDGTIILEIDYMSGGDGYYIGEIS